MLRRDHDTFFRWLPCNFILNRVAKSYGFIDPAMVKAGVIFQDRGLINWIFGSFRKTEIRCQRSAADSFFSRVITISAVSMVGT